MKRYNINPIRENFSWGEMDVIRLGQRGRGRSLALVPYHAPKDCEFLDISLTKSGKYKIVKGEKDDKWLAVVSGAGTYTRDTYGTVYCLPKDKENIKIVAVGSGAYGDAGRIGSWYDFLAIVPNNTFLKVRPAGGKFKMPRYWLYFSEDKVFEIRKEEIGIFCDRMDLEVPPEDFRELVDLSEIEIGI